jgi:YD repeat-containing protein
MIDFGPLNGLDAMIDCLEGDTDRFAARLQEAGADGLEVQLEDRIEARALLETLSKITKIGDADRKSIANAASVRLTLTPGQQPLNERSVAYDEQGRISRITDTPRHVSKLKIETFAHHTVLREDHY